MLFQGPHLAARELAAHEVPRLQALFDANPLYFQAINGRPAHADEAQLEFDERPPPQLPFGRHWFLGLFDRDDTLQGVAVLLQDFCAPGVWHIALYLLATGLHGSGAGPGTYHAMEAWMRQGGARWLRLGAVVGNARAERFWAACGFTDVRRREKVDTGGRVNDLRVMVKPLQHSGASAPALAAYLALVPRDRPDSPLP